MDCKVSKKILCVILSAMLFITSSGDYHAMKGNTSATVTTTEQKVDIRNVDTTDEGDVIIEVQDKDENEPEKSETCVKTYSMRIVKIFDTANMIMKIIGSMTVYGGTAKIISETFCENQVLYFVCAGVIIGIVEPIIKKVYNISKENAEDKSE